MAFDARVLTVLIASPGDTAEARQVVEGVIATWNRSRSRAAKVVLRPAWWEIDAVPEMGADGQSIVNRQLVDQADIVIALFRSRLGAPTARAASGTSEEIHRAIDRGIPVHVHFAQMPHPFGVDPVELERLATFRLSLLDRGLLGAYASYDALAGNVWMALEHDVVELVPPAAAGVARAPRHTAPGRPRDHGGLGDSGDLQRAFGRNLRTFRQAEGASQEAFAELIGVHRTYLGGLERGERNMSLRTVERLAEIMGSTPSDLLQ